MSLLAFPELATRSPALIHDNWAARHEAREPGSKLTGVHLGDVGSSRVGRNLVTNLETNLEPVVD